ncbi:zinc-binding dehydrogenase [Shewanella surugensis]|uniref:Zinc-binding dehydrogenase n=1 Tax=Shewanella surugensis TaxID=212020 RepID=A0ABT0LHI4_9GAMM|nr:zinc-binding dehydrogenase [Shewanella surugensis]MCL1127171.1 zinc-binding dehydrogenase [Shewanella surugensis]
MSINNQTIQSWITSKAGAISRLKLVEDTLVLSNVKDVCVAVKSVGLNFSDIFALTGLYSATPKGSFTPGLEFAGEVIHVGAQGSKFKVGDRVMGVTRFGGYTTHIITHDDYLQALPDHWNFEQGAGYLVQTLTAYYALKVLGNIQSRHNVLIHSAAGGVGLQAMRIVRAIGATPIGTVRSNKKAQFLKEQGFESILVREKNFQKQLISQQLEFDLVLDGIGGMIQKASFNALRPMGRLIVFGAAEFTPGRNRPKYLQAALQYLIRPKYDVMDMISNNKSVMAFNLIWLWEHLTVMKSLIADMGAVDIPPPHIGHVFPFDQAHQAIQCLRSGNTLGKVVLVHC